jgi:trehalose 6-phosphate synthase
VSNPAGDASALVVASNRGPVSFELDEEGEPVARTGAGGLASGLANALRGRGATWIAAASTEGDRVVAGRGPTDVDGVRLRLLDIPPYVYEPAYNVVANETLWFLHHELFEHPRRPVFDKHWYEAWALFRQYNETFARSIAEAAPVAATVLVHDYHLGLCGTFLARARPDLRTVHFTHTPWCEPSQLDILPGFARDELMLSMASFGACGFHADRWAKAFERCFIEFGPHERDQPCVFVEPLAADRDRLIEVASSPECRARQAALVERIGDNRLIVRSDRVELSKNILRGFRAYAEMLDGRRDLHGRVVFLALAYGSRERLPEYLAYRAEVEHLAAVVNERFGTNDWQPVELEVEDDYLSSVAALTRYDLLLVNPIRDGLNLVAKEGPIVNENDGVLALSTGAGAFAELDGQLEVHPYDVEQAAGVLALGLDMGPTERRDRAERLRRSAAASTPAEWLASLIARARFPG